MYIVKNGGEWVKSPFNASMSHRLWPRQSRETLFISDWDEWLWKLTYLYNKGLWRLRGPSCHRVIVIVIVVYLFCSFRSSLHSVFAM